MNIYRLLLILLVFFGCKPSEARKPVQQNSGRFFDTSIERNKALNEKEYTAIKNLVDEAQNPFVVSDYGFWYQYVQKNNQNEYTPKFGDQVFYTYTVKNLDGDWIYSSNETTEKTYFVEQEELFAGLREGLKLMKENETITFIFPSQLAYGYYGDNNKIGSNTPLIYEVTVQKILQNQ